MCLPRRVIPTTPDLSKLFCQLNRRLDKVNCALYLRILSICWIKVFPSDLQLADITEAFKTKSKTLKEKYDLIAFYLINIRYMRDVLTTKLRNTLLKFYLNIIMDFAKGLMHTT